ncbi:MAG: hypothetical protein LBR17_03355 [Bacteroidales bacterium]|jgi:hypothetical protein|nr:hypothetical protein [Bacteroidales bacterium]
MKSLTQNLVRIVSVAIIVVTLFGSATQACASKRTQAKNVINKTAYVIDEAYDMVSYYNYWQGSSLSKAVYYNDYAQHMYSRRKYSRAINYSLLARQYAVDVINSCDDYWEYFFYTYFGWSYAYGYNSRYNSAYAAGYRDGYYDSYYRAYCNRHDHYDSHYNPNGHNHHQTANDYNSSQRTTTSIGRGEDMNSRGGSTSASNGRERIGSNSTSFKEISTNQYFDANELQLVKQLPSETAMETDFKKDNPTKTFDDSKIANDTKAIETNRTAAKDFKPADKKDAPKFELAKPVQVVSERPQQTVVVPSKDTETKKEIPELKATQPVLTKEPVQKTNSSNKEENLQQSAKQTTTTKQPVTTQKQITPTKQSTTTTTTKKPAATKEKNSSTKATTTATKSRTTTTPSKSSGTTTSKSVQR